MYKIWPCRKASCRTQLGCRTEHFKKGEVLGKVWFTRIVLAFLGDTKENLAKSSSPQTPRIAGRLGSLFVRSRPSKPNQRKGQNEKFMNFAHFCEFWCFSLGNKHDSHIELLFRNAPAKSS